MPKACGSATAATAMNTAARPIMLWKKATSSGILVISTVLARQRAVGAADHQAQQHPAHARPLPRPSLTISAAVVSTAMAMPTMPNRLPRIEVVGCDRPFSAWMKQTLATRYSSVTRLRLICGLPSRGLPPGAFLSFFLNISSMRRVTRKPPKMLTAASATASTPMVLPSEGLGERRGEHGADDHDRRDRVGHRHQRRVQRRRDGPHHVVADVDGQHEDDQVDDGGRDASHGGSRLIGGVARPSTSP